MGYKIVYLFSCLKANDHNTAQAKWLVQKLMLMAIVLEAPDGVFKTVVTICYFRSRFSLLRPLVLADQFQLLT